MMRWLAALLISLTLFGAARAEVSQLDSLTVLAEPSLALPLSEITRAYSTYKQVSLLTTFADSQSQATQLQEGDGDVLLTSQPKMMQDLRQMGVVDVYSQTSFAANQLVLAAAESAPVHVSPLPHLLSGRPILLADPALYAEGYYGQGAIPFLLPDATTEVTPSLETLYERIRDGSGWGMMFETDAATQPWVQSVLPVTGEQYQPVVYQALVIAGDKMALSRDFVKYLKSDTAQAIFRRYGFKKP